MASEHQIVGKDEISLIDLWQIVKKRQKSVVVVFLLFVSATAIYLYSAPRFFESGGSFYIGQVDGTPLESSVPLMERIKAGYGKAGAAALGGWIESVIQDRRDPRLIVIKSRSLTPAGARGVAQRVMDEVISAHRARFDGQARRMKEELTLLEGLLSKGLGSLEQAKKLAVSPDQRLNMFNALYSSIELAGVQERLSAMRNRMDGVKTSMTEVLQTPTMPNHPSSPRSVVVALFGIFLGALVSIMSAFAAESISRLRSDGAQGRVSRAESCGDSPVTTPGGGGQVVRSFRGRDKVVNESIES